jgi:hypothetical protein
MIVVSGMYVSRAFLAAAGTVEFPFVLLSTIIFSVTFYWFACREGHSLVEGCLRLINLRPEGFGYFFLMIFTFQLFCVVLGQLIATASANLLMAQQVRKTANDSVRHSLTDGPCDLLCAQPLQWLPHPPHSHPALLHLGSTLISACLLLKPARFIT